MDIHSNGSDGAALDSDRDVKWRDYDRVSLFGYPSAFEFKPPRLHILGGRPK